MLLINPTKEQKIEFLDPKNYETTNDEKYNEVLRAADAHKRIRYNLQNMIKPGQSLKEVISYVEDATRIMLKGELNDGIGFPCGISLNDCAAHFSLNSWNDDIYLKADDVLKIDFGTHVNGRIVDAAFTVCFDERYENLLLASKEATYAGIKAIGIDTCVSDVGAAINEVMTSFEIEDENHNSVRIKPVKNLNGHSIGQFKIHDGIHIPVEKNYDPSRVKEGFVAVETFATTGRGYIENDGVCSHYMVEDLNKTPKIYNEKAKNAFELIKKEIKTLPFSPNHLIHKNNKIEKLTVKLLESRKIIEAYPPLVDRPVNRRVCKVAQFEHTLYLTENGKKIVSKGEDY